MRDEGPEITPSLLLRAYASGVFPMAEGRGSDTLYWIDPEQRGILPLDAVHVPRRLARSFLGGGFELRTNTDFAGVVAGCAERPETWINAEIERLYRDLHRLGQAHSVEIWVDGRLAGGLYGVALGAAFFGESMFSRVRDASKLAMIATVARLRAGGFTLFDAQFVTDHLRQFGAVEIPRATYRRQLERAINRPADIRTLPPDTGRRQLLALARP